MMSIAEDSVDFIPKGIECISYFLTNSNRITVLNLFNRAIKSEGLVEIEQSICTSQSLKDICLRYNNITHTAAQSITNILVSTNGILRLDLEDNQLRSDGITKLSESLRYSRIPCVYLKCNSVGLECKSSSLLRNAIFDNKWIISTSYHNMSEDVLKLLEVRAIRIKELANKFMSLCKTDEAYSDSMLNRLTSFKKPVSYMIWDNDTALTRCSMIAALEKITHSIWLNRWFYLCCICKSASNQESHLLANKEILAYIALFLSPNDITPDRTIAR